MNSLISVFGIADMSFNPQFILGLLSDFEHGEAIKRVHNRVWRDAGPAIFDKRDTGCSIHC